MYMHFIKRMFDIILSFIGLLILAIPLLIISLIIKLTSPGEVMFKQKRIGIHKSHFYLYKFRTMRSDTPHDMPTHLLTNAEQYITPFGKLLRRMSLDELPQLLNIFVGQMSIIGPRPALWNQFDLIDERDKYGANDVRPGLTGWAQINGRDALEIADKARHDGDYVAQLNRGCFHGVWMDIKCFFGTIKSVIVRDGILEGGTGSINKEPDGQTEENEQSTNQEEALK